MVENHARKGDLSPESLSQVSVTHAHPLLVFTPVSLSPGQVIRLEARGTLPLSQTATGYRVTVPPATDQPKSALPPPSNPKIQPMELLRELQEAIMARIHPRAGKHRLESPEMGLKSRLGLQKAKVPLQKAKLAAKATLRAILGVVSH